MIELDYQVSFAYPPRVVFGALTDVQDYPMWQSDVLAARVQGGGPVRLGAEISQVRKVMGRSTYLRLTVEAYQPDRELRLRTAADAHPVLGQAFLLEPAVHGGCCVLDFRVTVDGVPPMASSLAEALLTYQVIQVFESLRAHLVTRPSLTEHRLDEQLGVPVRPLARGRDVAGLGPVVQPQHAGQGHGGDQRVCEVLR